uniref:Probable inactive serine/threonine-protein kinase scy1 isoform X1 n=1 Tax=Diabrotica virgifera virgifera TaxID=50390 RepID=A0A6P7GU92_DIAVI
MSSNNISYQDANKQFPRNSYAKVTSINTEQTTNLSCLKTFPPLNPNNYTPTQFPSNPINKMSTNNIFYNNNSNSTNSRTFKRQRPNSPDPTLILHNEIISSPRSQLPTGGILDSINYKGNINNDPVASPSDLSMIN